MAEGWVCVHCGHEYVVPEYQSPLPTSLLETNDPALASDEPHLRAILQETERGMSALEATITRLEATLNALQRRKAQMQHSLMVNRAVLSPIRHVPAETLGEIFHYALGSDGISFTNRRDREAWNGPQTLSRVCVPWRRVLLGLSEVWAKLNIEYKHFLPRFPLQELKSALSRANSHPLRLNVHISIGQGYGNEVLRTIVEHSPQWKEVFLSMHLSYFRQLERIKDRVPRLEIFRAISADTVAPGHAQRWPMADWLKNAPSLQQVSLHGAHLQDLQLPWSQLTHFGTESELSLKQLKRMPNLASLTLGRNMHLSSEDISTRTQLTLSSLRKLELELPFFLPNLTLPALEELILNTTSLTDGVRDLIHRSSCSIRVLTVKPDSSYVTAEMIQSLVLLLRECPTLVTADLRVNFKLNILLSHLSSGSSALLPQLRTLILPCDELRNDVFVRRVVEMIGKRKEIAPFLEEVCFMNNGPYPLPICIANMTCFEAFRREGMKIMIKNTQ